MRTKEELYKELNLNDDSLTQDQLIKAMHENPKLIERPIVVNGDKARLGRPPEQVQKSYSHYFWQHAAANSFSLLEF